MSTRLVNFHRAAANKAPKGATHWRLIDIGEGRSSSKMLEMPENPVDPVLNGTLVFEWYLFGPNDPNISDEWTKLLKFSNFVKSNVFDEFEPDDED